MKEEYLRLRGGECKRVGWERVDNGDLTCLGWIREAQCVIFLAGEDMLL